MDNITLDQFLNPLGFALWTAWCLATVYCVYVCDHHPNIPVELRPWYNLLVLVTGPWGLAVLLSRYRYPANEAAAREYKDHLAGGPVVGWLMRVFGLTREIVHQEITVELCTSDGKPLAQIDSRFAGRAQPEESDALRRIKEFLQNAVTLRSTDVLLDPRSDDQYSIRFRIDGELEENDRTGSAIGVNMLNCLKIASKLDIAERRRPQDGSFMIKTSDWEINCRLACTGTLRGPKGAIRILDRRMGLKPITELGMRAQDLGQLHKATHKKSGLILICGPTGSGKTTTLYSILQQFRDADRNLVTIEDPIEYPLEHASQTQVSEKTGITFANALRSILRQNPDVILVGEIRDQETADLVIQASNTGHLVLSTIHGNDSTHAFMRLYDLEVPASRLSGALTAILSQRLVRRLCPTCRKPVALTPAQRDIFKQHNVPITQAYAPGGCMECRNTGYHGREGVFELLFVNRQINDLLTQDPTVDQLGDAAAAAGMIRMYQHGLQKVAEGITNLEEVQRVCIED